MQVRALLCAAGQTCDLPLLLSVLLILKRNSWPAGAELRAVPPLHPPGALEARLLVFEYTGCASWQHVNAKALVPRH